MGQRRTSRDERIVPVRLWGMDVSGQPFIEAVWTHNVSTDGALLKGVRRKLQAGDIVGITYAQKKARLRIVWIGQAGSAEEGHVGLQTLPGGENLWPTPSKKIYTDVYSRPPKKNQRQHERLKCNIKARLHIPGKKFAIWGIVEDICVGGCYVQTAMPLEAGSEISIVLFVNNDKLWADGMVISSHSGAGIGIKFTHMDRQYRDWLEEFVRCTDPVLAASMPASLDWVKLYQTVLKETDPQKRHAQIEEAERVIKQALRRAVKEEDSDLRRSLSDALHYLKLIQAGQVTQVPASESV